MHRLKRIRLLKMLSFLCIVVLFFQMFSACTAKEESEVLNAGTGINVLRDESYFAEYTIQGDRVSFDYVITFSNYAESDIHIKYFVYASFARSETNKWLQYEKFYKGYIKESEEGFYLKTGETKSVTLTFEGTYLGGAVNTNMKPPLEIMMLQDYVKPEEG